jgi:N-acetylglucosaminyl-diphospho-decaprenol L-rhamnosyltransferase
MTHPPTPAADPRPASRTHGWRPTRAQKDSDDGPIDISVCIANWNCRDYLRACLESLHDFPQGIRVETIVVDNGSADGAADMAAREFPEVVLVRNPENRGFACASNQGAGLARGKYLFFLNNDTIVPPGALRRLLEFAESQPEVGMIGPCLRDAGGILQISFRQRPTLAALLHRTVLLRWTGLLKRAYYRYRRTGFEAGVVRQVEVLMGAAVLMRRDVFEESGRWDEDFAFGGEDIELSIRVAKNRPLVYVPDIEIVHHGRISSRQNVGFAAPNVAIGYVHYLRKTGSSRLAVGVYKLAVTLDAPLHMIGKLIQFAWRSARGRARKAEKSLLAAKGIWHFLRGDLLRFWRA